MALDDENDCEYYALFGVSLPKAKELDSLISLYLFIIFTLLCKITLSNYVDYFVCVHN